MNLLLDRKILSAGAMIFLIFAALSAGQYHTILFQFDKGFSQAQIGSLLSIAALASLATPFLVLQLGRRLPNPNALMSHALLGFSSCLLLLPLTQGYWPTAAVFVLLQMCGGSAVTIALTSLLLTARPHGHRWFLYLRSWGTLGWAAWCALAATVAQFVETPKLYPLFAIAGLAAWLVSRHNPESIPHQHRPLSLGLGLRLLVRRDTLPLMIVVGLASLFTSASISVLGNFIRGELGLPNSVVSLAWTVATLAEILFMWLAILLFDRIGLRRLMALGMLAAGTRLVLAAQVHTVAGLLATQLLHGIFYGCTLTGMAIFLDRRFGKRHLHAITQANNMLLSGVTAALAGQLAGWVWQLFGLRQLFALSDVMDLLMGSLLLLFVGMERAIDRPEPMLVTAPELPCQPNPAEPEVTDTDTDPPPAEPLVELP
jgi:PPP family 3-phenylpropionic acid transporter